LSTRTHLPTIVTLAALVSVIGCAGIEQLAPPVGEPALREAVVLGVAAADVRHGRTIYVTTCAQCHSPEPVTGYTEAQWSKTLPRMSEQAMLSPQEAADVKAYVLVTLRAAAKEGEGEGP
jgi:mono/diheme cytochrome c family protein